MQKNKNHLVKLGLFSLLLQAPILLSGSAVFAQQVTATTPPAANSMAGDAASSLPVPQSPIVTQPVVDTKATDAVIAPISVANLPISDKAAPIISTSPGAATEPLPYLTNTTGAPAAPAASTQTSPAIQVPQPVVTPVAAPDAPSIASPIVDTKISAATAPSTDTPPSPTVHTEPAAATPTGQAKTETSPATATQQATADEPKSGSPAPETAAEATVPAPAATAQPNTTAPTSPTVTAATPAPTEATPASTQATPAAAPAADEAPVIDQWADTVKPAPAAETPSATPQAPVANAKAPAAPKIVPITIPAEEEVSQAAPAPMPAPTKKPVTVPTTASATPGTPTTAPLPTLQPAAPPPPKKVELPVPALPVTPATTTGNMLLPLNKTVGIDLDRDIRDVIIGNPDIADIIVRSQKQIFLIGKKTGDTNVFFTDQSGNLIRKIDIVVQPDVDGIQHNIADILPGERIIVKGMGDSVVLTGTASSDGVAKQAHDIARRFVVADNNVISMMRVTTEQQVLLRVRVAEAKKTVLKELGVDNLLSPQTLGPLTIKAATSALGLGPDIAGSLGIATDDGSSSTIRLLEQQGYIRTLAEPNLLAVSGEIASMLAGGEYPIPVAQQNGTLSVDYKPFGVILSFLPVVIDSGRISLRINTEVSALSDQNNVSAGGFTFKSFVTRRANSVVEMPSGGEIMIAGLLQNDITGSLNGVPGLMNLPILGGLFRSTSFQRNETELVILVSAILAKPADPHQFSLPTDGFAPSTDFDRYFLGHLQDVYVKKPPQGPNAPQSLQGPLGYIVQ